jgi:hypothetical protein
MGEAAEENESEREQAGSKARGEILTRYITPRRELNVRPLVFSDAGGPSVGRVWGSRSQPPPPA